MAEYVDPFTTVYRAIRDGMLEWHGIAELLTNTNLRLRNFPDMSDAAYTKHPNQNPPNDFPEFMLAIGGFQMAPFANSKSAKFSQSYPLIIATDKYAVIKPGLVKIHTLAALTAKGDTLGLPGLVHAWTISDGMSEVNSYLRPHSGWTTLLSINVEMSMARTDLLAI